MKFIKELPSLALQPYVRNYWLLQIDAADIPFQHLFFPFGFHELIFNLNNVPAMQYLYADETFAQPFAFYAGQFTRPFQLYYRQPCKCIGVSLHAWAGGLLFDMPSNYFTDQVQDTDSHKKFGELRDSLFRLDDHEQLFAGLDSFLTKWLRYKIPDAVSAEIAHRIIAQPFHKQINGTLEGIGLSRRRIEQRFLEHTGLSIGSFARKVRFQKAARMLRSGVHGNNLTSIGLDAGYFDQSHFISDFKEFAGTTPGNFVRQQSDIKDFLRSLLIC